jgi:hypothetical protein
VLAEDRVDVDRAVRLSWPACLRLLDEPHDRRVAGRELLFGLVGGACDAGRGETQESDRGRESGAAGIGGA